MLRSCDKLSLLCSGMLLLTACDAAKNDSGAAAGSGAAGASSSENVGYAATVGPLIQAACNCHQSTPLMAPFSLVSDQAYANLVNGVSMQLPTMKLVTPGKLNESYLWHKVNGTQAEVGGSGLIMPYTVPLLPDELAIIERWIAAGAPP